MFVATPAYSWGKTIIEYLIAKRVFAATQTNHLVTRQKTNKNQSLFIMPEDKYMANGTWYSY